MDSDMTPRIARTATLVHERDEAGQLVRTELVPANEEIPDWAADVGEHVVLAPSEVPPEYAQPALGPAGCAYSSNDSEEVTPDG